MPDEAHSLAVFIDFENLALGFERDRPAPGARTRRRPQDETLDSQSLPKVKMPLGDKYASLPDWKPRMPRLKGYPY